MRSPAVAAWACLLALATALSACSTSPAPTHGDDETFLVASADPLESSTTTRDGRTLLELSEPGYTVLLEPDMSAADIEHVAGTLQLADGCLEVAVDGDRARIGAVLAGSIGMGPSWLVDDGATLAFGERLGLASTAAPSIDEAPASYRAACPDITGLLGIGP